MSFWTGFLPDLVDRDRETDKDEHSDADAGKGQGQGQGTHPKGGTQRLLKVQELLEMLASIEQRR